jgi:hypothetical protein
MSQFCASFRNIYWGDVRDKVIFFLMDFIGYAVSIVFISSLLIPASFRTVWMSLAFDSTGVANPLLDLLLRIALPTGIALCLYFPSYVRMQEKYLENPFFVVLQRIKVFIALPFVRASKINEDVLYTRLNKRAAKKFAKSFAKQEDLRERLREAGGTDRKIERDLDNLELWIDMLKSIYVWSVIQAAYDLKMTPRETGYARSSTWNRIFDF